MRTIIRLLNIFVKNSQSDLVCLSLEFSLGLKMSLGYNQGQTSRCLSASIPASYSSFAVSGFGSLMQRPMSQQYSHMGRHGGREGNGFRFLFHIYIIFYFPSHPLRNDCVCLERGQNCCFLTIRIFSFTSCLPYSSVPSTILSSSPSCASLNNREHAEGSEARWRVSAQTGYCGTGIKARTTTAAVPGPL